MVVFINNKQIELEPKDTIPVALRSIQIADPKGIAVAVNNTVIPKSDWEKFSINENDQITVIRATQGG
jgi:sulfur carrier protein